MKLAVFASLLLILPFQTQADSCVGKKVEVWVINGNGLGLQYPDPYVKVTIGKETEKTKIFHGEPGAVWYQKLHFKKVSSDIMKIEVMEADGATVGNDDDHIGTCLEPMNAEGKRWQKLQCKTPDDGTVRLYYKCL